MEAAAQRDGDPVDIPAVIRHRPRPVDRRRGTILIAFAEALSAPEVAWNLIDAGWRVVAVSRSGARVALRQDHRIELTSIEAPERAASTAVHQLVEAARRFGVDAVMPLDDASLLLVGRAVPALEVPVVGPTGDRLEFTLDKERQVGAAISAGFAVPPTATIRTVEELLDHDDYPYVVKPALAQREFGDRLLRGRSYVVGDRNERARAGHAWRGGEPMLVQPLLSGVGEGLCGVMVNGELRAPSAHRRVRMMNPAGSGSSACVAMSPEPVLVEQAAGLLRRCQWEGLFMLEFLRDRSGTPWFMELNGRAWGSMALAIHRGLDYPTWAVEAAVGEAYAIPVDPVTIAVGECRHLGREILRVAYTWRGPPSSAVQDWPTRRSALRAALTWRRSDCLYNARSHRVLLADTVDNIGRVVRRGS